MKIRGGRSWWKDVLPYRVSSRARLHLKRCDWGLILPSHRVSRTPAGQKLSRIKMENQETRTDRHDDDRFQVRFLVVPGGFYIEAQGRALWSEGSEGMKEGRDPRSRSKLQHKFPCVLGVVPWSRHSKWNRASKHREGPWRCGPIHLRGKKIVTSTSVGQRHG